MNFIRRNIMRIANGIWDSILLIPGMVVMLLWVKPWKKSSSPDEKK